jgi:hypothetical protein
VEVGAIGALVVFAADAATTALQALLGIAGMLVAMVAFLLFGNPSAGLYPGSFVPALWRTIGPWPPGGAAPSALPGSVYLEGTARGGPLALLAMFVLAGTRITIALGTRRGIKASVAAVARASAAVAA